MFVMAVGFLLLSLIHQNQSPLIGFMHGIRTVRMQPESDVLHKINFYIQAILIKLIPCVMLSILTFLLIYAMHKAYKRRLILMNQGKKEESDRHHEHNRTTGMLLAVVVF
jgi:hypothetical protein